MIDFGGLFLNRQSHECTYNEVPLTLTPIEFDILWLLCENRGKVISSEELFHKVWKEECYKNSNNTVNGSYPASAGKNEWTYRKI